VRRTQGRAPEKGRSSNVLVVLLRNPSLYSPKVHAGIGKFGSGPFTGVGGQIHVAPLRNAGLKQPERRLVARLYFGVNRLLYSRWPQAFDPLAHFLTLGRFGAWRRSALDHLEGGRILEIGHGTGALLLDIARSGKHPIGLEISPAMQRVAQRRMRSAGVRVPCVVGDARALPFREGTFDTIVATFPTEYASIPSVLLGFRRLLPGSANGMNTGRIVLVGVCIESDFPPMRALLTRVFGPIDARLAAFTRALARAGFTANMHCSSGTFLRAVTLVGIPG